MGGNQKKKNRGKRKISSDSGEKGSKDSKVLRVGGSPGDSGQQSGQQRETKVGANSGDVEWESISDVIRETNKVLFEGNDSFGEDSVNKVFDSPVSGATKGTIHGSMEASHPTRGNQASPSNTDIMSLLKQINEKIQNVEEKLSRLESVEKKVDQFETDLTKIWKFINEKYSKTEERLNKVEDRLDETHFATGLATDKIKEMETAAKRVREDMIYIQSQSMRNNLVFSGIEDTDGETGETTERKLRNFMEERLQMARDIVDDIKFERVHRMGQRTTLHPARQIVAKFCFFKDRENVKKQRSKLKGSQYFINEQFPRDIVERRKRLTPKLMEARRQGKQAWLSYDKLIVDGRQMETNETDE